MVRLSGAELAQIIYQQDERRRWAEAVRILLFASVVSTLIVVGGSIASPFGAGRAIPLALGAALAPYVALLFATRLARMRPSAEQSAKLVHGGWP